MKIVATTRTLNEVSNVERFVQAYGWVDEILIADGGSEDGTPGVAYLADPDKVTVRAFRDRVYGKGGAWRNPHGPHINFLIQWAREVAADWMIFDDCDSVPTKELTEYMSVGTLAGVDALMVRRIYIWGVDEWFPDLSNHGFGLWAWKLDSGICAREDDPWQHEMIIPPPVIRADVDFPCALLHYFYPDEETVARKREFYDMGEEAQILQHPLDAYGPTEPLPDWIQHVS